MLNLTPKLIEDLDKLAPSPRELAAKVFGILRTQHEDLTDYELSCFAVEFLGMMVLREYEFLMQPVKTLSKDFYYAHYLRVTENLCQQTGDQELTPKVITSAGPSQTSSDSSPPK